MAPVPVPALDDVPVAQVSLGTAHCAAVTVGGEVLTWGHGGGGRLGHGDEEDQLVPAPLHALAGIVISQVVCGEEHTAAVSCEGRLWTWGCGKVR